MATRTDGARPRMGIPMICVSGEQRRRGEMLAERCLMAGSSRLLGIKLTAIGHALCEFDLSAEELNSLGDELAEYLAAVMRLEDSKLEKEKT